MCRTMQTLVKSNHRYTQINISTYTPTRQQQSDQLQCRCAAVALLLVLLVLLVVVLRRKSDWVSSSCAVARSAGSMTRHLKKQKYIGRGCHRVYLQVGTCRCEQTYPKAKHKPCEEVGAQRGHIRRHRGRGVGSGHVEQRRHAVGELRPRRLARRCSKG